jgi:hypothetical protein
MHANGGGKFSSILYIRQNVMGMEDSRFLSRNGTRRYRSGSWASTAAWV